MAPSHAHRQLTLGLLRGPVMEVTVVSKEGESAVWNLPKALLAHNSSYFQGVCRSDTFQEAEDNKVTLGDNEPEIFGLFVEFLYYGRYRCMDNLADQRKVRDSAKAWVLGDYLGAVNFKNFAMRTLYSIYFPSTSAPPRCGIGPEAIDHCCSYSIPSSKLIKLYFDFALEHWHHGSYIAYDLVDKKEWDSLWERHPEFRNELIYRTKGYSEGRLPIAGDVEDYLETETIVEETAQTEVL